MPRPDGPLVAIVTGAARGIGAATAARLADDGLRVVAVDCDAAALHDRWDAASDVVAVPGDVRDPAAAAAAVDRAQQHGALHVLVNNAGTVADRAFTAQADDQWDRVVSSLLGGTRTMTRAVLAVMCRDASRELATGPDATATPRRIITTVPAAAVTGSAGGSATAAAGGAVASLTTTLAREVGGYGIRVNAVLLGYIHSRLTGPLPPVGADGPGLPEPVRQMVAATTSLGRFGTPEEVAAVHSFLASDAADYITGAMIPVTGGLLGT